MNPLHDYINKARSHGQNDDQIKQTLVRSGWQSSQVDAALSANRPAAPKPAPITTATRPEEQFRPVQTQAAPAQNQTRSPQTMAGATRVKKSKRKVILLSLLVLVILVIGYIFTLGSSSGYQSTANEFISSIQKGDEAKADSLESPVFKSVVAKNTGNASFESYCLKQGDFCTAFFSNLYISKAKMIVAAYTSQNGATGKSIIYDAPTPLNDNCNQSTKASGTLEIDLVSSKGTWLVDNVSVNGGVNGVVNTCK